MTKKDIVKFVNIKNKKASFEFEILDKYTAGMVLKGTEIKSIRMGKVNFLDSFCFVNNEEIFIKNLNIAGYEQSSFYQHEPSRSRKLLLNKKEIVKIKKKLEEKGLSLIPLRIFTTDRGFAKMDIALAKGKKTHDKRDSIKEKDMKREMDKTKL